LQHAGGIGVEPIDLPVETRHLDVQYGVIRYTDKPYFGAVTTGERAEDSIEMSRILFGADFVDRKTVVMACLNSASPLVWDGSMLAALKIYARHGQAIKITPFTMAGASSPVTLAGTLTQIYAEAVVGIAFAQVVRKGTPVVFGNFGTPIDMQSGAPTFGGPEAALLQLAAGQLARRLKVPYRSAGCYTSSKVPDAQSAMESTLSLLPAVFAGSNMMQGCAGWLEGGLVNSFEKFIQDEELLGAVAVISRGMTTSLDDLAMDAFREVGPANHFLGCAHTQRHFLSAVHRPAIADNKSFEQWEAEGRRDSVQRAHEAWKSRLEEYQPPPIDPAVDEELQAFMTRRKSEQG
jgi:trimethylamine--corrinoid protein Co-methyltransferase